MAKNFDSFQGVVVQGQYASPHVDLLCGHSLQQVHVPAVLAIHSGQIGHID